MSTAIHCDEAIFKMKEAAEMEITDLDAFYDSAKVEDRMNLYFELEASFLRYLADGYCDLAAHVAYLAAYYIEKKLHAVSGKEMASYYLNRAIQLCPANEYLQLLAEIKDV